MMSISSRSLVERLPRIVGNPTAGFPLMPSFGVRVRF